MQEKNGDCAIKRARIITKEKHPFGIGWTWINEKKGMNFVSRDWDRNWDIQITDQSAQAPFLSNSWSRLLLPMEYHRHCSSSCLVVVCRYWWGQGNTERNSSIDSQVADSWDTYSNSRTNNIHTTEIQVNVNWVIFMVSKIVTWGVTHLKLHALVPTAFMPDSMTDLWQKFLEIIGMPTIQQIRRMMKVSLFTVQPYKIVRKSHGEIKKWFRRSSIQCIESVSIKVDILWPELFQFWLANRKILFAAISGNFNLTP